MSAETLRRAASEMREYAARGIAWESEWDGNRAVDKGWLAPPVALAVAVLLDSLATCLDEGYDDNWPPFGHAFAVTRAYLAAPNNGGAA